MNKKYGAFIVFFAVFCFSVVCIGILVGAAGTFLVVNAPLEPADAVVVLSGGELDRLEKAVEIIQQGYTKYLILTETEGTTESGRKSADYFASEAHKRGIPVPQIIITRKSALNTQEEAYATLEILNERGWKSLIIVTDPFHTRRSLMVFRDTLRKDSIKVVTVASQNPRLSQWFWYLDKKTRITVLREYISLLAYFIKK